MQVALSLYPPCLLRGMLVACVLPALFTSMLWTFLHLCWQQKQTLPQEACARQAYLGGSMLRSPHYTCDRDPFFFD